MFVKIIPGAGRRILSSVSPMVAHSAKYKNFVMSDALAHLESQCERYCLKPRFPPQKVCYDSTKLSDC